MMIDTRNAHEAFICKHISNQLLTEGYPPLRSQKGNNRSITLLSFNGQIYRQQSIRRMSFQSKVYVGSSQEIRHQSGKKEGVIWH